MALDKIDMLVLNYPDAPGNAKHLDGALQRAREEVALLEECLMWGCDDDADAAIRADLDQIKSSPGYANQIEGGA
jgi:hypothetical protein